MTGATYNEDETRDSFPQREAWSAAAVRLLQGVIYHDDPGNTWELILANKSPLTDYFGQLGQLLIVDEQDGMAWLHQPDADELPLDYETLPKLFRSIPMGFDATLLCVLLRDELRRSEEEDLQNERCVVRQSDLLNSWQMFFPQDSDAVRMDKQLSALLGKLEKLKFVRRFERVPASWEVRRILRARLPLEALNTIRDMLADELTRRNGESSAKDPES